MGRNAVANIKTVNLDSKTGPLVTIMVAVDIDNPAQADAFLEEVAQKFLAHRMLSPPETAGLLVTIIGDMPVARFAQRWQQLKQADPTLAFFMSQMRVAKVLRGKPTGEVVESRSLLEDPATKG